MSIELALHRLVYDYKGGVDELARLWGLSPATVRCMANPNDPTHGWPLNRFREAMHTTGDLRPLESLCQEFDGVLLRMPKSADKSLDELMASLVKLSREFGDVPRTIEEAGADSHWTRAEVDRIRREVYELQAAAAVVLQHIERLADSGKPLKAVK